MLWRQLRTKSKFKQRISMLMPYIDAGMFLTNEDAAGLLGVNVEYAGEFIYQATRKNSRERLREFLNNECERSIYELANMTGRTPYTIYEHLIRMDRKPVISGHPYSGRQIEGLKTIHPEDATAIGLLASGLPTGMIAEKLGITQRAVEKKSINYGLVKNTGGMNVQVEKKAEIEQSEYDKDMITLASARQELRSKLTTLSPLERNLLEYAISHSHSGEELSRIYSERKRAAESYFSFSRMSHNNGSHTKSRYVSSLRPNKSLSRKFQIISERLKAIKMRI